MPLFYYMLIYIAPALFLCIIAWIYTKYIARKISSLVINEKAIDWKNNTLIISAISIATVIAINLEITYLGWITYYIDQILVIALSLLFIKEPYILIKHLLQNILGNTIDEDTTISVILTLFKDEKHTLSIKEHFLLKLEHISLLYITIAPLETDIPLEEYFIYTETLTSQIKQELPNIEIFYLLEK